MAWRYLAESLPDGLAPGDLAAIGGEEARHAAVVARVAPGERLSFFDGRGRVAEGVVTRAERDAVELRVESVRLEREPSPELVLVQALAKGDRDELAAQAATELGAAEIVPWQAARSVSRWDAKKAPKQRARWQTIVREAAKQSLRPIVPEVAELATTRELAALASEEGALMLVLEPSAGPLLADVAGELAAGAAAMPGRIVLVVGPEGGVAPEELAALEAAGARLVRLGSPVLRTSTAGPAAIAALSALLGRWSEGAVEQAASRPANRPWGRRLPAAMPTPPRRLGP